MKQMDFLLSSCSIILNTSLRSCDIFLPLMNSTWSPLIILPITIPKRMTSGFVNILQSLFVNEMGR